MGIFQAVTCITQTLNKALTDIKITPPVISDITADLTDLSNLQKLLNDDTKDDSTKSSTTLEVSEIQRETSASSQQSASATSSLSTSSISLCATQTASNCRVACHSASCSTTCYLAFTGCSVTGTTSTISSSASACAYNPVTDGSSSTIPLAAFVTTAWWDYGISCAVSCASFVQPSASVTPASSSIASSTISSGTASITSATRESSTASSKLVPSSNSSVQSSMSSSNSTAGISTTGSSVGTTFVTSTKSSSLTITSMIRLCVTL